MTRTTQSALDVLGRFNGRHPWSHNDAYAPWVLRQAHKVRKGGGTRALDVGCGTGNLVRRLAEVMPEVAGLEPHGPTAETAEANARGLPNVTVRHSGFAEDEGSGYDLITFVAVLHHLPLRETLSTVRARLAPGGRLVIVGVAQDTPADWPWWLLSTLLNPLVGLVVHPRAAAEPPVHMTAPSRPADETYAQLARIIPDELPGARMRRGLFWRYTAVWVRPVAPAERVRSQPPAHRGIRSSR